MLTDQELYEKLSSIASRYEIFQCQACADEIQGWLQKRGIHGIYIKISTRMNDFMISTRVGSHTTITQNGCHYGVEVRSKVFDNLSYTGIPKQEWLDDFECIGGFDIEELRF